MSWNFAGILNVLPLMLEVVHMYLNIEDFLMFSFIECFNPRISDIASVIT